MSAQTRFSQSTTGTLVELPIVEALDAEWRAVVGAGRMRIALKSWGALEPGLAGFADYADLEAASWAPDLDARDEMLLALVRRAQDPGEEYRELAGRCVLQLLRPGLLQAAWDLARRRRWLEADEIASALFGAAHETVVRFRAGQGRRKVAASLVLGARKNAVQRGLLPDQEWPLRGDEELRRHADELHDESEELAERDALVAHLAEAVGAHIIDADDPALHRRRLDPESGPDARDELLALLVEAVRARALSAEDARLTASSAREGVGYAQLAAQFGVSEPAVRKRRSRSVARLAKFVGARGHKPALAGA
jgi:hypothetical protein